MAKKIGVVLSGCGVMDGSEIHEAVLTLLALSQQGADAVCMAPDMDQLHVMNHLTQEETRETRNVLAESARIARGKIRDVRTVKAEDVDGLIFPGGYGAVKNLCTFASEGPGCKVNSEVARLARDVHKAGKPIGAICISPALMAKIFEGENVRLTIGNDSVTAAAIQKMGQRHVNCEVTEACVDSEKKLVSTPAYMLAQNVAEAFDGIQKLVRDVLVLAQQPARARK